jgi:predicted  nucleic acid-binding Zn-ribbon protein
MQIPLNPVRQPKPFHHYYHCKKCGEHFESVLPACPKCGSLKVERDKIAAR